MQKKGEAPLRAMDQLPCDRDLWAFEMQAVSLERLIRDYRLKMGGLWLSARVDVRSASSHSSRAELRW
jgi:hypothetical protein